jgi:hypothetical protein
MGTDGKYDRGCVTEILPPEKGLTSEQAEDFRRRLERALDRPVLWVHPDGKARRRLPLPLGTRIRLRARRRVDRLCTWLCGVRCDRAAWAIWRMTGMIK